MVMRSGIVRYLLSARVIIAVLLVAPSCDRARPRIQRMPFAAENQLFTTVSSAHSGIDFSNELVETLESNYYRYMYTYIGGGVAAADFNNDGLVDLFFTSNTHDNKLYLNEGRFRFKDITAEAGIEQRAGFDTGVAVADVNNDGFLDIYISRGGWQDKNNAFANMLYLNDGAAAGQTPTFTEQAAARGLADANRSIQATFFDYDRDNDLDVYVANTPDITNRTEVVDLVAVQNDPKTRELKGSDRLYRNDGTGHFTDVSEAVGILPDIGFGLNPQVGDLNHDGWPDVYVCNDFNVPDFAYVNNGDGTFTDRRDELLRHMSFNSMGSDMADINNDGRPDLMTLDMNPEDYVRSKTTMAMTSIDQFERMVDHGYHHQYMHNMLHLSIPLSPDIPLPPSKGDTGGRGMSGEVAFSEIAQMAGMANTDWSWAILSADFDLDGYNDIYVTNGVFRDVIDRDKNNEILQILRRNRRKPTPEDFLSFAQMLPQQKLTNYFYRNRGDLTFENTSAAWADTAKTFSNGAVYADLDNDGDLDVVVNNINDEATVLRNNAVERGAGQFLQVTLAGPDQNRFGVGATVTLRTTAGATLTRQLINTRGFLSSVSNVLHFGLEAGDAVEHLRVTWPDGKQQEFSRLTANQRLTIRYADATRDESEQGPGVLPLFTRIDTDYHHTDPPFNDYDLQILLPHKLSQTGPAVAKADVNQDGREDIYLGGGHQQAGQVLLGQADGSFRPQKVADFERDRQREDVGACFFDADNDGDPDLYVVSGSYEMIRTPKLLRDRLYLNDGRGHFTSASGRLPDVASAGSVVVPADFDEDGDTDLFVGGRVVPGKYPYPPTSFLLRNERGSFTVVTPTLAPELAQVGMVTDAAWADMNGDGHRDLLVTGEWMGIEVFLNEQGKLMRSDAYPALSSATGWWNKLLVTDIDHDGDPDVVAGNLGLNYKFHASEDDPLQVYTHDFDFNGTEDVILAQRYGEQEVPVRGKTCMTQQMPHLAQKIPTYEDFASRELGEIVGRSLASALHYQATEFRSGIFINDGTGQFSFLPFTNAVQQSPITSIVYQDLDGDQKEDLLLAGNNYLSEVETTRADAGIGSFLKGDGRGNFTRLSPRESGFFAPHDVRQVMTVATPRGLQLWVANNNHAYDLFRVNSEPTRFTNVPPTP